jgi:tripartite-type tricarboxylate transporter receptor subunit TctC
MTASRQHPQPSSSGAGSSSQGRRAWLKRTASTLASVLLALTSVTSFAADDYPSRPVTIIVPFAAGGSADVYARIVAQQLTAELKQSFIVDDRPGAGAIIGTQYVSASKPDGYTLLLISNTHTVNETLYTKKPFKLMTDFVPVAPINSSDLVLVTRPDLNVKTVADLIKLAKSQPGKLTYASSGYGTPYHMAGELFKQMAGVSILHVPYKGSSQARTDVIGGQVDMMFDATTTMAGFISGNKVKALATTGLVRSTVLPNLPTVDQAGVPKYNAVIWLGLMAPKNTPPAVVDKLNAAMARIVAQPEIKASWEKQGAETMSMKPAEFTKFMNDDIKKWAEVVKISGAKVDQ